MINRNIRNNDGMKNMQPNDSKTGMAGQPGIFRLQDFDKGAREGWNNFTILDAKTDSIKTVQGEVSVISLSIELIDNEDSSYREVLTNYLLFVDTSYNSPFHQFALAVMTVRNTDYLDTNELVGMKGIANLSYYKPKNKDVTYPKLTSWSFRFSEQEMNEALDQYLDDIDQAEDDMDWSGEF